MAFDFSSFRRAALSVRTVRSVVGIAAMALLAGTNLGAGCFSSSKPSSLDVPLEYNGKSGDAAPLVSVPQPGSVKLYVSPVTDKREDTKLIGKNVQDSTPIPIYGTGKTISELVTEVLRQELRDSGLDVLNDVSASTRTIETELTRFNVEESGRYSAEVRATVKVVDPTGKVVWQGTVTGTGGNWGKTLNVSNYQETYSKALKEMTMHLLTDSRFVAALSGTGN